MPTLLNIPNDPPPAGVFQGGALAPILLTCEHAAARVPSGLDRLGLNEGVLESHIARDFGAFDVAQRLAVLLKAPLVYQRYSRLVVDCNRSACSRSLICEVSDATEVPGNAGLSSAERLQRIEEIYNPFHQAVSRQLQFLEDRITGPAAVVSVHSFTPVLDGKPRPWGIGVCYDPGDEFARSVLRALEEKYSPEFVGDNQPYQVEHDDGTQMIHGIEMERPNVLIELRQDLLVEEYQIVSITRSLAEVLSNALQNRVDK